ncbi:MAG: hypothetical protein J3R72DRAFT_443063, partial [Linnemannia gamsii]
VKPPIILTPALFKKLNASRTRTLILLACCILCLSVLSPPPLHLLPSYFFFFSESLSEDITREIRMYSYRSQSSYGPFCSLPILFFEVV